MQIKCCEIIHVKPAYDSWGIVVFPFILDLATVNAGTIMKYNIKDYGGSRGTFIKNLATSPTM